MGVKVNPDNWLSTGSYLRYMWHFATTHEETNPYNRDKTQIQRRMSSIKTFDGPIHTIWVRYTQLRYNWFTIGFSCWRNGHDYYEQFIAWSPEKTLKPIEPGRVKWVLTGRTEKHTVSTCRRCGRYQGHRRSVVELVGPTLV